MIRRNFERYFFLLLYHSYHQNLIYHCYHFILKNCQFFQAAWSLKLSCLAEKFYVDELENDERGVAELFLDDTVLASKARPGTSLSRPITSSQTSRQAIRLFIYLHRIPNEMEIYPRQAKCYDSISINPVIG